MYAKFHPYNSLIIGAELLEVKTSYNLELYIFSQDKIVYELVQKIIEIEQIFTIFHRLITRAKIFASDLFKILPTAYME